jgi:hypothetical protein
MALRSLTIFLLFLLLLLLIQGSNFAHVLKHNSVVYSNPKNNNLIIQNLSKQIQPMFQQIAKRKVRHFSIYKRGQLALVIDERPGQLHSTAGPGPQGPPNHLFLDATAFYTLYENEMGILLRKATNFDQFLGFLLEAGYDVASVEAPAPVKLEGGFRIQDTQGFVGVVWKYRGQFTTLSRQPVIGELIFEQATLTAYRDDQSTELLQLLQSTESFEKLCDALKVHGFQLNSLK